MQGITLTKKLVFTGVFSALAFAVSYLEIPIFVDFLKLDFSLVFILLIGFMFGLKYGMTGAVVKEFLCFLTKSSSGGIGELANLIVTFSFIILPTLLYSKKKGLKNVILFLVFGIFLELIVSLLTNRFILFPLYSGSSAKEVFNSIWYFIILFNLIKTLSVSIIVIIIYKRISFFIKGI